MTSDNFRLIYEELRPFLAFLVTVLLLWVALRILHEPVFDVIRAFFREAQEFSDRKPTLRSLNFFGMVTLAAVVVLFFVSETLRELLSISFAETTAIGAMGLKLAVFAFFVGSLLLCIKIVKNE
jgi:hypothetical protein